MNADTAKTLYKKAAGMGLIYHETLLAVAYEHTGLWHDLTEI